MSQIIENQIPHASQNDGWQEHVASWFQIGGDARELSSLVPDPKDLHSGCTVAICTYKRADSLNRFLDSLHTQERKPDQLIIVDASPDDETELSLRQRCDLEGWATHILYLRVSGPLRGLTRQRNFALRWVTSDLVAFFDDDIVLKPKCLEEMERVHRDLGDQVVGVGAYIENQFQTPTLLWRIRRLMHVVPSLRAGSYARSGMSVSWDFLKPTDDVVEGDWLSGCCMMWRTVLARFVRFDESFSGYCNGEDLDFSLRMGHHGKLMVAGKARLLHLHASSGRPNAFEMGYWTTHNLYRAHRKGLRDRTLRDTVWFFYAFGLDALVRSAALVRPGNIQQRWRFVRGRAKSLRELIWSGGSDVAR